MTGATGGVGSTAVAMLAGLGFSVTASTGRPDEAAFIAGIGATAVIDRAALANILAGKAVGRAVVDVRRN